MLTVLASSLALAASFARVPDLAELAEQSSSVIEGEVTAAAAHPAPYGVATRYDITVERTLAGAPPPVVSVELPGGRLGSGPTQRFSGVPTWSLGDRVVVFVPPPGEPTRLAGLFSVGGDERLVDPIERPAPPESVADLARQIGPAYVWQPPVGEADLDTPAVLERSSAVGTSDP